MSSTTSAQSSASGKAHTPVVCSAADTRLNDCVLQRHFHLRQRPFASCPSPDRYFAGESIENARQSLMRLLERHEGPGLVVGAVGTGKSLLMRLLAAALRDHCRVILLPGSRLSTRRSLLQVILYEIGLPYRGLDEGELRLALIDFVGNRERCPTGILLLVDEADGLALPLLDELRSMTNLMTDGEPRVRLVLFGSQRLEERFAHPRLESFNQRLAGRFYLEPLSQDETRQYVQQLFTACGGDAHVFSDPCLDTVHHATNGTPRLINQLCDHALVLAAVDGRSRLDPEHIEEAWADLQQLPNPVRRHNVTAGDTATSDLIEFGPLDDTESLESHATDDALSHLEQIEQDLSLAQAEAEQVISDEADEPVTCHRRPQVELIFHPAHDPFSEEYAEEELIIDQYASADSLALRHRRQVSCADSHQIAAQLDSVLRQLRLDAQPSHTRASAETPDFEVAQSVADNVSPTTDTADDGCILELRFADAAPADDVSVERQRAEPAQPEQHSHRESIPHTDVPAPTPKRANYRRLFSQLRRGVR